jgi:hypothetical protein
MTFALPSPDGPLPLSHGKAPPLISSSLGADKKMPKRTKFRFLTMEEFRALSRPAKFRYLDEAVPEIVSEKGSAPVHILFIERRTKPRKATSGLE